MAGWAHTCGTIGVVLHHVVHGWAYWVVSLFGGIPRAAPGRATAVLAFVPGCVPACLSSAVRHGTVIATVLRSVNGLVAEVR